MQQDFDRLQSVTARHNGAIIKTIGDAVMAAFLNPADAVQAALDMRIEIASFNERQPDGARSKGIERSVVRFPLAPPAFGFVFKSLG